MAEQQEAKVVQDAEIKEWLQYPTTKAVLQIIKDRLREAEEAWSSEAYQRETAEDTALANAKALGGVQVLKALIQFFEE